MKSKSKVEVGRLAFRVEGEFWNAYATPGRNSMEGAVQLGSIRMNLARDSLVKESFMATMQMAVSVVVRDATGTDPTWGALKTAPERERSGRA
jgi:hypothetical protein